MKVEVVDLVANPSHHSVMFGGPDVADEPKEASVAFVSPFGQLSGQVADCAQDVHSGVSSTPEYFHDYLGGLGC